MAEATAAYKSVEQKPASGIADLNVPLQLHGSGTPPGDAEPWKSAPLGSTYVDITNGEFYQKIAEADADADWEKKVKYEAWMDMITAGAGVPDNSDNIVKGALYLQTDAADNAVALFVQVDDADDANDWNSVSLT